MILVSKQEKYYQKWSDFMVTILVVEDDDNTRLLTEAHLYKKYNVVTCKDGEEVWRTEV